MQVYEMDTPSLHAKTMTVDGIFSSVGSWNLDRISWNHNLEVSVTMLDPQIAKTIEEQFLHDIHPDRSRQITLESLEKWTVAQRVWNWMGFVCVDMLYPSDKSLVFWMFSSTPPTSKYSIRL
eukprot:TRINITY_DN866_c0_g1_i4.p2 TRINITY_DN866_c0_g1~~TRINITY_DN866_c0_g1_i4.p2  ORF type:complete len:122 (-),score=30.65 TRINITY_DN866_c0_g1_i4:23-388(-)